LAVPIPFLPRARRIGKQPVMGIDSYFRSKG
jgi:hypothetical protein